MVKNRAVFLDDNGVLTIDTHHPYKYDPINVKIGRFGEPGEIVFLPESFEALKLLNEKTNYKIFIVTGKGGIAQKYFTEEDFLKSMEFEKREFEKRGGRIDGFEYCPHLTPEEKEERLKKEPEKQFDERYIVDCNCRKPRPEMIQKLAQKYGLNLTESWGIGDQTWDIEMYNRAGIGHTIEIIDTQIGKGMADGKFSIKPEYTTNNVLEAVNYIISKE